LKINLPIDLVTVNCVNPKFGLDVLEYCNSLFNFSSTILISNETFRSDVVKSIKIEKLTSINSYNDFILKVGNFTSSDHVLIVQDDGFIINKNLWNEEFLSYDYIGAPWPLDEKWFKEASKSTDYNLFSTSIRKNRIGNGGFSLRSKNFLEYSNKFESCKGWGEDFFLCALNYDLAIEDKIKFPNIKLALSFSYENGLKGIKKEKWKTKNFAKLNKNKHFGWHGKQLKNYKKFQSLALKNNDFRDSKI